MSTYQELRDIICMANKPDYAAGTGFIYMDVEFLNRVSVMVEEFRDSIELIQRLKGPGTLQVSIGSYLATRAIDQADFVAHKYWPEEKQDV
jgi:hypothetical protein